MFTNTPEYRDKIIKKFDDLSKKEMEDLLDVNSYTSENEYEKLHLLGYVLHKLYCSSSVDPTNELEKQSLFGDVERFYKSVKYCKDNIDNICMNFENKIKLIDIENRNEFVFNIDSIYFDKPKGTPYKRIYRFIPEIQVANTITDIDFETKTIAYKYLYSVIVKSYGEKSKKAILPIIIFQSIFHKSDLLFRAVDDSFYEIIKDDNHPLSKYNDAVVKYIKNKRVRLYYTSDKDKEEGTLRENGFNKKSGEAFTYTKIFHFTPFDEHKPPRGIKKGLDAIGWYNYFFELCMLIRSHKSISKDVEVPLIYAKDGITDSLPNKISRTVIINSVSCTIPDLFEINYIAFLCLSDIFDEIFINGRYVGTNKVDTYIYPAFRWGIVEKMAHKADDVPFRMAEELMFGSSGSILEHLRKYFKEYNEEYKKNAFNFLLDYMGIRQKREYLRKPLKNMKTT